jgi:hypothetical protein
MRQARPGAILMLFCLLSAGCASAPAGDTAGVHPPPFNRTVSWYDDYTLSAQACWRTNSQPPNCPGLNGP